MKVMRVMKIDKRYYLRVSWSSREQETKMPSKAAAACTTNLGLVFFALWIARLVITVDSLDCSTPWSSACFDRSRCLGPDGSQKFLIYLHDLGCTGAPSAEIMARREPMRSEYYVQNGILKEFRELVLEKGLLADKIEDACIIAYVITKRNNCVGDTAEWDMGRNHLQKVWEQ